MCGAAATTAAAGTVTGSDGRYDRVVDIVEAGADPTGEEPIDDVFASVKGDDTLVEFPSGRFKINQISLYGLTNFGMRGLDDDVVLVADENHGEEYWIAGSSTRNVLFENFTLDHTVDGVSPSVEFGTYDGLVVKDVVKEGSQDGDQTAFGFRTYESGSSALVENLELTDGSIPDGPVAVYVDGEGTAKFRNCRVAGYGNNGLYGSWATGAVQIEGGLYKNNDRSQIRLGGAGSYVDDAAVVVDDPDGAEPNVGIRVSNGVGPVTVTNTDVSMTKGRGSGAIVAADNGGTLVVEDSRIHIGSDFTTNGSGGTRTAPGIFLDTPPGSATTTEIASTSITGGENYYPAVLSYRSDVTVRDSCIQWSGPDGIWFDGSSNDVSNTNITVSGDEVVGEADVSGVTTGDSCPRPSFGGDDGSDDGEASLANAPIPGNASELTYPVMGTDSENPTLTVYGNFVYPNTREFALGNLPEIHDAYVASGDLNVEFRCIAYDDDHRLNTVPGEVRLAQLALGVWDQNDWDEYWSFFEYCFEQQGDFEWHTYEEAVNVLERNDVRNSAWIPALAGVGEWEDELRDTRIAATDAGLEYVPQIEFRGDLASATWDTQKLLDWIGRRL
ncbi:hypothetical protein [Halorubellus litoreus]|uniref:Right handed beta helix region n=1 Tax=Halorubellus litoreus TaxID=755308 RepID=A0ABD5VPC4_9EURY